MTTPVPSPGTMNLTLNPSPWERDFDALCTPSPMEKGLGDEVDTPKPRISGLKKLLTLLSLAQLLCLTACNLTATPPVPQQEAIRLTAVADATRDAPSVNAPTDPPAIVFAPEVVQHIQAIHILGQALGNRPDVFVKVGDSITVSASFLHPVGDGNYNLGEYTNLQPVITAFSATRLRTGNSFNNRSVAAGVGWSAFAALSTSYTDGAQCNRGETPLVCEYRLNKPSIALIMYGTNDVGYRSREEYRADLERIIEVSESMGVIPVLSTIPNRPDTPGQVQAFNQTVAELTASHQLPLWDYYAATINLPGYGLTGDQVHPSSSPGSQADFRPENLRYGYVMRNLTALQMLDSVWKQMQ